MVSIFQEKYNNCVVTALLHNHLALSEKERKIQQFINDPERYEVFCDNVYSLMVNRELGNDIDTLYLTIDGYSFISNSTMLPQPSCFPVLTLTKDFLRDKTDISVFVEIALYNFSAFCEFARS